MEKAGILSLVHLTKEERETFLSYLYHTKETEDFDILYAILGKDILKFIDVFSGSTVKVPRREEVNKIISYIKIYEYCKARNFTEESIESASKIFVRRKNSIVRVIDKIDKVLQKEEKENGHGEQEYGKEGRDKRN